MLLRQIIFTRIETHGLRADLEYPQAIAYWVIGPDWFSFLLRYTASLHKLSIFAYDLDLLRNVIQCSKEFRISSINTNELVHEKTTSVIIPFIRFPILHAVVVFADFARLFW